MEKELMAYIGGVIDGDGSLSLCKKHDEGARSPSYFPMVQFSKSRIYIPKLLHETFGGSFTRIKRSYKNKPEYRWKLEKQIKCLPFLQEVAPYLNIKSDQAYELIKFINENEFKRGSRLTHDILIKRERVYFKIKNMNAQRDTFSRLKTTKRKIENELFWPYFAGLMDTDGSFSIKRESRGSYSPIISLSLVNVKAINFIELHCKYGSVCVINHPNIKQKFYYRLGIYNKDEVISVLEKIIPYLINKRTSAEILYKFCTGYIAQHGRYLKTCEQSEFREEMYKQLIQANDGVYKPSLIDLELLPGNAGDNRAQASYKLGSVNVVSEKAPNKLGDAEL